MEEPVLCNVPSAVETPSKVAIIKKGKTIDLFDAHKIGGNLSRDHSKNKASNKDMDEFLDHQPKIVTPSVFVKTLELRERHLARPKLIDFT